MAILALTLLGVGISMYLTLYHWGWIGTLQCGLNASSCQIVQASSYSQFLGLPVALWGGGWYLALGGLAATRYFKTEPSPGWRWVLGGLAWVGLLFTLYLTYLELFVLHALCWWCVVSAMLVVGLFVLIRPWPQISQHKRKHG